MTSSISRFGGVCVVAAIFVLFAASAGAESPESGDIVLEMEGLENEEGVVRCGLYTESNWLESENARRWVDAAYGDGDTATCTFDGIEEGTYGIGAFHDADSDHDMDSNMLGIPTEGVCASNDPDGSMGPPSFSGAKFEHDGDETSVSCEFRN